MNLHAYLQQHADQLFALIEDLVAIESYPGTAAQNDCQDLVRAALGDSADRLDEWTPDWSEVRALEAPRGRRPYVPVDHDLAGLRCVVATTGAEGPHLVLNGHVDVVPADASEWTSAPFRARRAGDRLYARGAMDMKAGLAAAVFAFKAVADLGLLERGTLSLASVPEEESGGNGTLAAVARGHVGDAVIFAEPTDLRVVHRHVGIHSFAVEATGRAGGILRRSWGVSAIESMGDAIVALRELAARRTERAHAGGGYEPDDDPGFINVGLVSGGEWPATRAAACRATGLMGILPGETLDAAEDEFRAVLAAARRDDGAALAVTFGEGGHGGDELPVGHPLVRAVLNAGRDANAPVQPTVAGTMVCDAKIVSGCGWAPSVAFGPVGSGLHAADEWVDLPSVLRVAEVLARTAVHYCRSTRVDFAGR